MDITVNNKTVICFDLDDTLYNELDFLRSAYLEIAGRVLEDDQNLLYAKMFSLYRSRGNVFEYLEQNYGCKKEQLILMYRDHLPNIEPFEGVKELFGEIKSKNGKLCLITDGRSTTQRNKLKAMGFITVFDEIVISEEIGTTKPSENNYIIIENRFPGCSYTYIGDNLKKDFVIPNKRNWHSIGLVDNGKNIHNTAFDFSENKFRPKELITSINQINIK